MSGASACTPAGSAGAPDALLAVEHRPAEVVPQPLVVEYELANRLRELVALPPALESPRALALSFRRGSTCGLDRIPPPATPRVSAPYRECRGGPGSPPILPA